MRHKVISDTNKNRLEVYVTAHLNYCWKLCGGVSVTVRDSVMYYHQAVSINN